MIKRIKLILWFLLGSILIVPAGIWWILTGKDFLSPIMERAIIKYLK